ncbi:uncharacterized protein LOC132697438 isoform X2 [Cylas formicarius]|uniref:uncharacterized protein LOC132697438 isoform X2 n=1 Tax=Cylas formicarius TaxID=197179 RepID=UPI002958BD6B|nr:uncharacterized protein LOC132697438 isoform X2 [Cylas formicarius]
MNKDEFDLFPHLRQYRNNSALDLLRGLEDREYGTYKRNAKSRENVELYAEERLVQKQNLDEMRCEMPGMPRSTFLMVFSPDGQRAASTHGNHNIYVTDLRNGKNIKTLVGHPRTPWCIAFHPTSDQIVASGCLGGQVRIWDLSGGSEVWTSSGQSVIASIAFHPNDRILVIATFNEVYFWDWSQPEPFVSTATNNPKEKVRYVAFDKLGHKLITGIANGPQTRWERVRAPVPVPRQERCASTYRRRIIQRLVTSVNPPSPQASSQEINPPEREASSGVPERERRIMLSYRNLVREYEQLVHRYLQLYRPPTMIDRGTDPMEPNPSSSSGTQTPEPGPSGVGRVSVDVDDAAPGPSTSQGVITPSRMLHVIKKPTTLIRGTQTASESRKHKADGGEEGENEKRFKRGDDQSSQTCPEPEGRGLEHADAAENRVLVVNLERLSPPPAPAPGYTNDDDRFVPVPASLLDHPLEDWDGTSRGEGPLDVAPPTREGTPQQQANRYRQRFSEYVRRSRQRIAYIRRRYQNIIDNDDASREEDVSEGGGPASSAVERNDASSSVSSTSASNQNHHQQNVDDLLSTIRRTAEEEVRSRILPIIRSVPVHDRPELIRLFETSREHVRMRFRQMCPVYLKRNGGRRHPRVDTSTDTSSSDDDDDARRPNATSSPARTTARRNSDPSVPSSAGTVPAAASTSNVRNFNTELEQLVTSLLTEIERNDDDAETTTNDVAPAIPPSSSARTRPSHFPSYADDGGAPPPPPAFINTNTRTTNSTIYTTPSANPARRRFFLHRVSAFMPTRVNYTGGGGSARSLASRYRRTPHYPWTGARSGAAQGFGLPPRGALDPASTFSLDELINYAERENSEDDPPPPPLPPPPPAPLLLDQPFDAPVADNFGIGTMYSNIIRDLQSSLIDVRHIGVQPDRTSDVLSSFSERLENVMNQSDTILQNLRSFMEMLPAAAATTTPDEPRWNLNDAAGFYVRDLRAAGADAPHPPPGLFATLNAVTADHTYPRSASGDASEMSPLMTSLHLTISYIQRQARLLRRQVESIERIDRAMVEVAQLQLMRQLIIDLVRHIRNLCGDNRSPGVSSVRQMMAGTRISDSSPYDSPSEEGAGPSSDAVAGPSEERPQQPPPPPPPPPRTSNRKTYPPSRLSRPTHYQLRPSMVHWFSRRYSNRLTRQNAHARLNGSGGRRGAQPQAHYANVNPSSLALMTIRLERLMSEQVRAFTRPRDAPPIARSTTAVDLGEHILSLRLHGCLFRMNRVLGVDTDPLRSDATAAVTQDGASRYDVRHSLSLVLDSMSRHVEEIGNVAIPQNMRHRIHGVLAMSLLLTELLLLQVADSIPPAPARVNLEPESLTDRINQMCTRILHRLRGNRPRLTRNWRLMMVRMRHAYRALDETYNERRSAMLPRQDTDRRQLLGSINLCLRTIRRRYIFDGSNDDADEDEEAEPAGDRDAWFGAINDLIARYSDEDQNGRPSTSSTAERPPPGAPDHQASSNNDNSDGDDATDSEWWYRNSGSPYSSAGLYRTNNVNLVQANETASTSSSSSSSQARPWNVPTVQVNDVPVPEPSLSFPSQHQQRSSAFSRQRFAERVSELRSNARLGLFRPRFLHPLYASVNPFDADLDDPQREAIYDSDMITTVTPNHRIQAWDISNWSVPAIGNSLKNVIVSECKIHNDASVDIARDGTILVTLLPSGGYLNVTNRLGVYSLRWETLGQCLYTTSFEQNAVSVSLSPLSRHLVVGFASRRVAIVPSDRWVMARVYKIEQKDVPGDRLPSLRELEQSRESRINCIRWLPTSGQGLIYATNTGQLVILS